jgi:hypothetical protein
MLIAKNDEAKRSIIWRNVTIISSVLIVIVAVFFLTKLFMSNPLEGTWENEDNSLILKIKSNNSMVVDMSEVLEESNLELKMKYTIDKEGKTLTIAEDPDAIEKAVKNSDGEYTEEMLENALSSITTTFDYSVDHEQMTLTEREYGEQMIFIKK